jgi:hypothetical protein
MKSSSWQKSLLFLFSIITLILLIYSGLLLFKYLKNYDRPFIFAAIFTAIGFPFAIYFERIIYLFIKSRTPNLDSKYWRNRIIISLIIINLSIHLGLLLNECITKQICEEYFIINKNKSVNGKGTYFYNLFVKTEYDTSRVICSFEYWKNVSKDKKVFLCINRGLLGFEYYSLPNDN